ncbi:hypothetical protein DFA_09170 [Cavenderia fasciculata]|uniref:Uncharacterized protein n=1 Tax=Cavenderia fasciculata TaxID=261658 RepID=F4Q6W3_CACFS|nr:uncharacterized protein DFA_09170 [Cavenderia fasciculata]EGG16145.1 hypothetical protein DFA_09170 [Cavenderia fasciculata]|eukprot:XP_004352598.1 hypothetical protein DFA_09170 [Cavenderia fasciculata]
MLFVALSKSIMMQNLSLSTSTTTTTSSTHYNVLTPSTNQSFNQVSIFSKPLWSRCLHYSY